MLLHVHQLLCNCVRLLHSVIFLQFFAENSCLMVVCVTQNSFRPGSQNNELKESMEQCLCEPLFIETYWLQQLYCEGEQVSHLCDAHRILRSTADEVKLPELPHLDGPVGLSFAAHRLIEGIAASLAGGSTQPLRGKTRERCEEELTDPVWVNRHSWHFHW